MLPYAQATYSATVAERSLYNPASSSLWNDAATDLNGQGSGYEST